MRKILNLKFFNQQANFIFLSILVLYLLLWFINPINKIILLFFLVFLLIIYFKTKNFYLSFLVTYLVSSIVLTGKTYTFELIPPGIYSLDLYPYGYLTSLIISPKHVFLVCMLLLIARSFLTSKKITMRIEKKDLLLIAFFLWIIISNLFASQRLEISLPQSIMYLEGLVLYFYVKFYLTAIGNNYKIIISVFSALIFVQFFVSIQQFIGSAPIGKNIEFQRDIEFFGSAADELLFRFRPLGTLYHANMLGIWLSFLLGFFGAFILKGWNRITTSSYILGIVLMMMTLSRSAWISFVFSLLFSLYVYEKVLKDKIKIPLFFKKNFVTLSMVTICVSILFVLPRLEKSFYSFGMDEGGGYLRQEQIKETIKLISVKPLFGTGSGMSVLEELSFNPLGIFGKIPLAVHNWYLLIAVEHGIIPLVLFIIFLVISLKQIFEEVLKLKQTRTNQMLKIGGIAAIFSVLIAGVFQPYIGEELILFIIAFVKIKS